MFTTSASRELFNSVDNVITFKPVDFNLIRHQVRSCIARKFSSVIGDKLSIQIEDEALEKMFSCFTTGQCSSHRFLGREGLTESHLMDIPHGSEYMLTYEDQNEDTSRSRPLVLRWSNEELRFSTGNDGVTRLQHCLKLWSAYYGVPRSCRTRE